MSTLTYEVLNRDDLRRTLRVRYTDGVNEHTHTVNLPPVVPGEDYEEVTVPARIEEIGRGVAVKLAIKAQSAPSST